MNTLAAFWFAAPWMLLGIGAIILPIAAHLIAKRTRRLVVFPTTRLLQDCVASQSTMFRIRRLILLLLRCLLMVFVAAAFAQPGCSYREQTVGQGEQVSMVLLLDVSASMQRDGQRAGEHTQLMDALQNQAGRALDQLKQGTDQANIILVGAAPKVVFPFTSHDKPLSVNIAGLRLELTNIKPTNEHADWVTALGLAGQMLENANGARRIVVISDMQQSNWAKVAANAEASSANPVFPERTVVLFSPLPATNTANLSLSSPRIAPTRPLVARPTHLYVDVTNHGRQTSDITISAQVNGQTLEPLTIQIDSGQSTQVAFDYSFQNADLNRIEFEIEPDAFNVDNRAYLVVRAVDQLPIILVGDDDPAAAGTSSFFLHRALTPHGNDRDRLSIEHLTSAKLSNTTLDLVEAVLISEVNALPQEALIRLANYVHAGGGVAFFCGDGDVATNLRTFDLALRRVVAASNDDTSKSPPVEPNTSILPWWASAQRVVDAQGRPLHLGKGAWGNSLLSEFDEQGRDALKQIAFRRVWATYKLATDCVAILQFDDDTPAIGQVSIGEGRVLLLNFSPSLTCSDLGKYGSFVAFTQALVNDLRRRDDRRASATVAQAFQVHAPVPLGETVGRIAVLGVDGQPIQADLIRQPDGVLASVNHIDAPGFAAIERNSVKVADVAINLNPDESDARRIDAEVLADSLANKNVSVRVDGGSTESRFDLRGQMVWYWCLLAAALMMALECLALIWWKH